MRPWDWLAAAVLVLVAAGLGLAAGVVLMDAVVRLLFRAF